MRLFVYLILVGVGAFCLLATGTGQPPNFQLGPMMQTLVEINPSDAVLARFNRDGCLDLAVTNEGQRLSRDNTNDSLSILFGACDGTFRETRMQVGNRPVAIAQADFNGDGCADLAVANKLSNTVSIVTTSECSRDNVKMTIKQTLNVPHGPQAVATADFNDDDCPDLVVASFNPTDLGPSSAVSVFIRQAGCGAFDKSPQQILTWENGEIGLGPIGLAAADFDNDGCPDLAVANSESSSVAILKGTCQVGAPGKPPFLAGIFTPIQFDNAPWSLKVADFNRDGDPDLVAVMRYSNNIRIFLGTGAGGFVEKPRVPTCSQPVSVAAGDFDDDGLEDLAVACFESANVKLYRGRGDGEFDFITTVAAPAPDPGDPLSANVTAVVAGEILSGKEGDDCDDIAFLVAPNTPVPPDPGTVAVQSLVCTP